MPLFKCLWLCQCTPGVYYVREMASSLANECWKALFNTNGSSLGKQVWHSQHLHQM